MFPYHKKAHGKLLLSGEYFVLNGAPALVLPLKFGQTLTVSKNNQNGIYWESYNHKQVRYFDAIINTNNKSTNPIEERLNQLFAVCKRENPSISSEGALFHMSADFDLQWGLGSSSTLVALLADYHQINPYALLQQSFGGSGYDVAAAFRQNPFLYQRKDILHPDIQEVKLHECWKHHVCFVYLGNKQDSREGIQIFKSKLKDDVQWNREISELTNAFVEATNEKALRSAVNAHESFISTQLEIQQVKEKLFSDYPGEIKSLGAWGGDFVMVVYDGDQTSVKKYFHQKGYDTLFFYQEIICQL